MLSANETGNESNSRYSNNEPPALNIEIPKESDLSNAFKPWKDVKLPIDILLLTVKDYEFRSCYFYLKNVFQSYKKGPGFVYFGQMGDGGSTKLKVALIKCLEGATQPGDALLAVKNTVVILRPKAVFCVGCCGALHKEKTKLGDVVVSSKLTTYADRTVTSHGIQPRGYTVPVGNDIAGLIKFAAYGWRAPLQSQEDRELVKVHCDGEFLSGPEEIDSDERRQQLVQLYPNAIAVEMDGQGKIDTLRKQSARKSKAITVTDSG